MRQQILILTNVLFNLIYDILNGEEKWSIVISVLRWISMAAKKMNGYSDASLLLQTTTE